VKANIVVTLKQGVLDPQGKAVAHALGSMNSGSVNEVRIGKFIEIDIDETDETKARQQLTVMCDKLLANPVMENYRIELIS
jgi:phosphoribosylformylglycinamidine synthase